MNNINREAYLLALQERGFPIKNPTMEDLWNACIKLTEEGDLHLEACYGSCGAAICAEEECKDEEMSWNESQSGDPIEALARLWYQHSKGGRGKISSLPGE